MSLSHLSVVAVIGVARPTAVKVTHVLLQGPNVLNERQRDRGWCLAGGEGYFTFLFGLGPSLNWLVLIIGANLYSNFT